MSCLQKTCTIRSQPLSASLGSLTSSLFALYDLNEKQILKFDGIYSDYVLYWEMWLFYLGTVKSSVKKRDLMQKEEKILFLKGFLITWRFYQFLFNWILHKHTELLEKENYVYWGNDDLHT